MTAMSSGETIGQPMVGETYHYEVGGADLFAINTGQSTGIIILLDKKIYATDFSSIKSMGDFFPDLPVPEKQATHNILDIESTLDTLDSLHSFIRERQYQVAYENPPGSIQAWNEEIEQIIFTQDKTISEEDLTAAYDDIVNNNQIKEFDGCTFVFGNIPVDMLLMIMDRHESGSVSDSLIASRSGATLVMGTRENIDRLLLGNAFPISTKRTEDAEIARSSGASEETIAWIARGSRGLASDFMAARILGLPHLSENYALPKDHESLGRCFSFIDMVNPPGWIEKMTDAGSEWQSIIKSWDILSKLYANNPGGKEVNTMLTSIIEKPEGSSPQIY